MKKRSKPKARRSTQELDLDKHCGVALPTGGLCGRSLTCKTHSMGAKRAVKGRTQPYDTLLAVHHQKKTIKQAQISAIQKREEEDEEEDGQPLTDQEEVQLVFKGVFNSTPEPLCQRVEKPIRQRTSFVKMRELFFSSVSQLPQAEQGLLGGAILGRAVLYNPENGATTTRPSRVYAERMRSARANIAAANNASSPNAPNGAASTPSPSAVPAPLAAEARQNNG